MRFNIKGKKVDFFWWGWKDLFMWPFISYGIKHENTHVTPFTYLIIGAIEIRKWG
jgi:hypothetical protein